MTVQLHRPHFPCSIATTDAECGALQEVLIPRIETVPAMVFLLGLRRPVDAPQPRSLLEDDRTRLFHERAGEGGYQWQGSVGASFCVLGVATCENVCGEFHQ